MPEELNATQVVGGGRIYQRKEGGAWKFCLWVEGERCIRKSLKTRDKAFATREAERLTIDAKAAQRAGHKVLASSLADCVDAYAQHQQDRLRRGEIRSESNVRYKSRFLRNTLSQLFGLDRSIATLTQKDWDRFIPYRLDECGAALDTVRQECCLVRGFCKFSQQLGGSLIPELKVFVPKQKRSKRKETFSQPEVNQLKKELDRFIKPDTKDGLYVRGWSLGSARARQKSPKNLHQDLEKSRRELLRYFVLVSHLSGCRPHELKDQPPHQNTGLRRRAHR